MRSVQFAWHREGIALLEATLREYIVEELEVVTLASIRGFVMPHVGIRLGYLRLLMVR